MQMPLKVNFPGQCLLCTRWLARLQTCLKLRNCSRNLTRTQMAPSVRRSSLLSLNKIKTYLTFYRIQLELTQISHWQKLILLQILESKYAFKLIVSYHIIYDILHLLFRKLFLTLLS